MYLGVTVLKGHEEIEIHAPVVISNAGIFNTFQKFLPQHIQDKPGNVDSIDYTFRIFHHYILYILQCLCAIYCLYVCVCRDPVTFGNGPSRYGFFFGLCWPPWNQRGPGHCFHQLLDV